MCKVIRFKKTVCTVHLAAEIRRCWRCSWVVFIHVVFQQYPLLDERAAAGKKLSFAWWFCLLSFLPCLEAAWSNNPSVFCSSIWMSLFDMPNWESYQAKQRTNITGRCYEVHGTLKVPTSKPVLTVMTSDFRTKLATWNVSGWSRFHRCLDYTLEAHVWHPLII